MKVDVNCKSILSIDIDSSEAFKLLLKTLDMDFIMDDPYEYYTCTDENGEKYVCVFRNGHDERYDDRGDLYEALIAVANCMFPNMPFR